MAIRKSLSKCHSGLFHIIILLFNSCSYSLSQCHSSLTLILLILLEQLEKRKAIDAKLAEQVRNHAAREKSQQEKSWQPSANR